MLTALCRRVNYTVWTTRRVSLQPQAFAISSSCLSIVEALERNALSDPNKPAFIFVNEKLARQVLTRQQVWDYSRKFAAVLRKTGLRKGDVICNTLPNSPQSLICLLGTIAAGCITVAAQSSMADGSDLVSSLNRGKASGIILNQSDTKGIFPLLKPRIQKYDASTGEVSCQAVPSLKYLFSYVLGNGSRFLQSLDGQTDLLHEEIGPNDICAYMSTSGSTGDVKLVPFSSFLLLNFAEVSFGDKRDKIYMCDLDMGWVCGFPHVYLYLGSTSVLLDKGSELHKTPPELLWKMAVQEQCKLCFVTPQNLIEFSVARSINENAEIQNYKLETIASGGGAVSRKQAQAALGEIADELVLIYGSTESSLASNLKLCCMDDYDEFNTGWLTKNNTVKIVDCNDKEVPLGNVGEILIQTRGSFFHYVNDPENTSKTFGPDGWIRLGDMGKVNAKGQLYVMGRNKFAISKGTIVFYPEVIESFVRKCPGIKDVVIVGVPDEKMLEEICALIIKENNADISEKDVFTFCDNLVNQDRSMVPKYVIFVDNFPFTLRGKLNRRKIKKLACQMLGL